MKMREAVANWIIQLMKDRKRTLLKMLVMSTMEHGWARLFDFPTRNGFISRVTISKKEKKTIQFRELWLVTRAQMIL